MDSNLTLLVKLLSHLTAKLIISAEFIGLTLSSCRPGFNPQANDGSFFQFGVKFYIIFAGCGVVCCCWHLNFLRIKIGWRDSNWKTRIQNPFFPGHEAIKNSNNMKNRKFGALTHSLESNFSFEAWLTLSTFKIELIKTKKNIFKIGWV